jgi:DNA-binding transcriptional regulator YhcF (GntR family)
VVGDRRASGMALGCDVIRFMTSEKDSSRFDLADADLRVTRGSVPASAQLAGLLKAQILEQRLAPGSRLPTEQELIARSGLSRVTVRAAVGILEDEGWLIRRQGLGTFVAEPVEQELESGVRTITEVLVSRGVTPRVEVLSHEVVPAPERVSATLGRSDVLRIQRRFSENDQPLAIVTAYLPADLPDDALEPLLSACALARPPTRFTPRAPPRKSLQHWGCRKAHPFWCCAARVTPTRRSRWRSWSSTTVRSDTNSPSRCLGRCRDARPE